MEKSREQFEEKLKEWWSPALRNLARDGDEYRNRLVNFAWFGWQACREAIEVELPEMLDYGLLDEKSVKEAITSLGLKVKS